MYEKAWSKVKGSYDWAQGGFWQQGMRALTGLPTETFDVADITDTTDSDAAWTTIQDALAAGHMVAATISGSSNTDTNDCGLAQAHVYNVIAAFELTDSGSQEKVYLMRNPWGSTGYNGYIDGSKDWAYDDPRWTTDTLAELEAVWSDTGDITADPSPSVTDTNLVHGYFVVPSKRFQDSIKCFDDYVIAYDRTDEGYKHARFDVDDAPDNVEVTYTVNIPAQDGDLYFTSESYPVNTVPGGCTDGTAYYNNGANSMSATTPWLYLVVEGTSMSA